MHQGLTPPPSCSFRFNWDAMGQAAGDAGSTVWAHVPQVPAPGALAACGFSVGLTAVRKWGLCNLCFVPLQVKHIHLDCTVPWKRCWATALPRKKKSFFKSQFSMPSCFPNSPTWDFLIFCCCCYCLEL